MIISDLAIRPMAWRGAIVFVGIAFLGIGASIVAASSHDPGSVVIGICVGVVGAWFAFLGSRIGAFRTADGFEVRQIGRRLIVPRGSGISMATSQTWWGGALYVPTVSIGDGRGDVEVLVLAAYAITGRARSRAERCTAQLAAWVEP